MKKNVQNICKKYEYKMVHIKTWTNQLEGGVVEWGHSRRGLGGAEEEEARLVVFVGPVDKVLQHLKQPWGRLVWHWCSVSSGCMQAKPWWGALGWASVVWVSVHCALQNSKDQNIQTCDAPRTMNHTTPHICMLWLYLYVLSFMYIYIYIIIIIY